jgi:hypothetical protein
MVVNELERQTGLKIEVKGRFLGDLTAEVETSSLEEGLRRLFHDADVVLFYAREVGVGESRPLARVWLFPRDAAIRRRSPSQAMPAEDRTAGEDDDRTAPDTLEAQDAKALETALVDSDLEAQTRALELLTRLDGPRVVDRLLHMASSVDPMTRLQALSVLPQSTADEATVLSALRTALADPHRAVKEYAIEALASQGGSQAMTYLQQAFRDPDPKVRMTVLENVAQHVPGHPLLRAGLSDRDDAVREVARYLLTQPGSPEE